MTPGPGAGLCDRCRHQKLIGNTRGSTFSMCLRSREDASFPKYPRIPVVACRGFEERDSGKEAADAETSQE